MQFYPGISQRRQQLQDQQLCNQGPNTENKPQAVLPSLPARYPITVILFKYFWRSFTTLVIRLAPETHAFPNWAGVALVLLSLFDLMTWRP